MSIQVDLSGLSFFVLDTTTNVVLSVINKDFENTKTPQALLDQLEHAFNNHDILKSEFSKVQLIHSNNLQTLVPSALFEESALSDYIKYNTKIFKTDFITYDVIQNEDIMVVYVPFVNINNYIFERFGSFEYKHSATVLIDRVLQLQKNTTEPHIYININHKHFEITVTENNLLKLYNSFEYETPQDFIYYVLFTAEQLNMNPEQFKCILMGKIKESDDLFKLAYKYIRHISILSYSNMKYHHKQTTEHFTLLNSL